MSIALQDAGIELSLGGDENAIDLFNCHAASTKVGDSSECEAVRRLVANAVKLEGQKKNPKMGLMCANKGQMGHLASGTGVTESIFALQSMLTGRVPGLVNFDIGWS